MTGYTYSITVLKTQKKIWIKRSVSNLSELRWDPFQKEYIITATHRQDRTFKPPKDYCPFCPEKDPDFQKDLTQDYDIAVVKNRFPSLTDDPPTPEVTSDELYRVEKAEGLCEVILFTSKHDCVMSEKTVSRFLKLVKVWKDRYEELGSKDVVDYVFIFENKGKEVGVTLEHPHGQIYAYPFVPPMIERELESSREHYEKEDECLFCRVLEKEIGEEERIVLKNDSFTAFVPFYARYTYEVHIYANEHLTSLADFTEKEEEDLAKILKRLLMKYDGLFGFEFPYVMAMHQKPTKEKGEEYSHFHIEFYPPYRTENKLKHLAGSEIGAGTFINNSLAEEKAEELREFEIEDINV